MGFNSGFEGLSLSNLKSHSEHSYPYRVGPCSSIYLLTTERQCQWIRLYIQRRSLAVGLRSTCNRVANASNFNFYFRKH